MAGDTITLTPEFSIGYGFTSSPAGAEVWKEGQLLGFTPYVLRLPDTARAHLTFAMANYDSAHFAIDPDSLAAQAALQRQYHIALRPTPAALVFSETGRDEYSARGRHRKLGFLAAGASLAAGIGAVWFKQEADEAYAAYLVTGAPLAREHYYDRAQQYDRYFSAAFGISQACFVFSVYNFIKAMP